MLVLSWAFSAPSAPFLPWNISHAWKGSLIFFFPAVSQIAGDVCGMGKIRVTLWGCNTQVPVRPDQFSSCCACHELFWSLMDNNGTTFQLWLFLMNWSPLGTHSAAPHLHSSLTSGPRLPSYYSPCCHLVGKLSSLVFDFQTWLRSSGR